MLERMTFTESHPNTAARQRSAAVAAAQTLDQMEYIVGHLPSPPARVLDVGCGAADLARELTRRGFDVSAIDADPQAVATARASGVPAVHADIADYHADPFDAVVCSLSLHHVERLDASLTRIRDLLLPRGVLVIDEFAWDQADLPTAAWFHDFATLLGSAGMLRVSNRPPVDDPMAEWVGRHRDHGAMHTGDRMLAAVAGHFDLGETTRGAYLHRYLGGWLTEHPAAADTFAALQDLEQRHLGAGRLRPVGLRLTAQR